MTAENWKVVSFALLIKNILSRLFGVDKNDFFSGVDELVATLDNATA